MEAADTENTRLCRCEFTILPSGQEPRRCGFVARKDSVYCGNHAPDIFRETCPDCSTAVMNLPKHRKKCPVRVRKEKASIQPYFRTGINRSDGDDDCASVDASMTASMSTRTHVARLIAEAYETLDDEFREPVLRFFPASGYGLSLDGDDDGEGNDEGNDEDCGRWKSKEKHNMQQLAILGQMEAHNVVPGVGPFRIYLEFGCGRGYLSLVLSAMSRKRDPTRPIHLVLIDRDGSRFKADRHLRQQKHVRVERIRIDLADLVLEKLPLVTDHPKDRIVGMSKHLCGEATDFALRSVLRCGRETDGIFIAPCCRHRCRSETFFHIKFFTERGFTLADFNTMAAMSSWVSIGGKKGFGSITTAGTVATLLPADHIDDGEVPYEDRCAIGMKARRLLDAARVLKLRELGYDANVVQYVDLSVTLENVLLVVKSRR